MGDILTIKQLIDDLPPKSLEVAEQFLLFLKEQARQGEPEEIQMKTRSRRPLGLCAGEFVVPDNFDDPLPNDILNGFVS